MVRRFVSDCLVLACALTSMVSTSACEGLESDAELEAAAVAGATGTTADSPGKLDGGAAGSAAATPLREDYLFAPDEKIGTASSGLTGAQCTACTPQNECIVWAGAWGQWQYRPDICPYTSGNMARQRQVVGCVWSKSLQYCVCSDKCQVQCMFGGTRTPTCYYGL